jgi:hypothetical protein
LKINNNLYGVQVKNPISSSFYVDNGSTVETKVDCSVNEGNFNAQLPQGGVMVVAAGIKCSFDLFYFQFPILIHTLFQYQDEN